MDVGASSQTQCVCRFDEFLWENWQIGKIQSWTPPPSFGTLMGNPGSVTPPVSTFVPIPFLDVNVFVSVIMVFLVRPVSHKWGIKMKHA